MMQHDIQRDTWKQLAGNAAAKLVEDGMVIGLGTGSTVAYLIYALAQRIHDGLRIVGAVPTSQATYELAQNLGIPLTDLNTHPTLDLCIDGADEIDSQLNLIKGGGGALLREKVVASVSRRFVVIADQTKKVPLLGSLSPVPVEVFPLPLTQLGQRLEALGATVQIRHLGEQIFVTDNHNNIFDCTFPNGIADPVALDAQMQSIVGVLETGLFLHMAQAAIIGGPNGVKVLSPEKL